MPAAYQGTVFRASGRSDHRPEAAGGGRRQSEQRARLDLLGKLNEMDAREVSRQFGTGGAHFVLRAGLPDAGLRAGSGGCESRERKPRASFTVWTTRSRSRSARQCLMARRLVERGVRFVQLYHGGLGIQNIDTWDAHADVQRESHAARGGSRSADRGAADGSEGARPAGFHAGDLAGRIRTHADLAARRRAAITIRAR